MQSIMNRPNKLKAFKYTYILLISTLFFFNSSHAETTGESNSASQQNINTNIQDLKNEVLELNRDLFVLEEDLLFSANTQVNVFVSMDAGKLFNLDSVKLIIDDKTVSNYLYTEREINALRRGGVQRLYIGNLTSGQHEITAVFIGQGPSKRDYKRAATQKIDKTNEAQFVELKIIDNTSKEQPDFVIKVWE